MNSKYIKDFIKKAEEERDPDRYNFFDENLFKIKKALKDEIEELKTVIITTDQYGLNVSISGNEKTDLDNIIKVIEFFKNINFTINECNLIHEIYYIEKKQYTKYSRIQMTYKELTNLKGE